MEGPSGLALLSYCISAATYLPTIAGGRTGMGRQPKLGQVHCQISLAASASSCRYMLEKAADTPRGPWVRGGVGTAGFCPCCSRWLCLSTMWSPAAAIIATEQCLFGWGDGLLGPLAMPSSGAWICLGVFGVAACSLGVA